MTTSDATGATDARTGAAPRAALTASLSRRLLDLLFPPRCVHCHALGEPLCAACLSAIQRAPAPRCARCDLALFGHAGPLCSECAAISRTGPPVLERIVVASVYDGSVASAIRALKFRGQRRLAQPLARLLFAATVDAELAPDVVIPMPLHSMRRHERGYNQATLLARPLARALRVPLREDALARTRATQPQTRLSRPDRHANVAGAFALTSSASRAQLAGKRLLLVDDVTTTGATLAAAAEALRDARPETILALAVARPMRSASPLAHDLALDL